MACNVLSRDPRSPVSGCWWSRTPARTGGSALTAVRAVRDAGGEVLGVATVVDRDTGAAEAIEADGLPYRSVLGLADLGLS